MENKKQKNHWNKKAEDYWKSGKKLDAIDLLIKEFNNMDKKKPLRSIFQLVYYLYFTEQYAKAAKYLEECLIYYPDDENVLLNLGVCLSKSAQFGKSLKPLIYLTKINSKNYVAYDILAKSYYHLNDEKKASFCGTKALTLKDKIHTSKQDWQMLSWKLPKNSIDEWIGSENKINVIAYSLWGDNPRYLRGAIDNILALNSIYPNWIMRFYVDSSVPKEIVEALKSLGAQIKIEKDGQSIRKKLTWRFKVCNDPEVGRFLIRDVDSRINLREKKAVEEWISSNKWFHVMRDWWTHTDLILAGMWGGVSGVLPSLVDMLETYESGFMETPNIDQWFLKDKVWGYITKSCMVHDRCFTPKGVQSWPDKIVENNFHVGQNEFVARKNIQEQRLIDWMPRLISLKIKNKKTSIKKIPLKLNIK